MDRFVSTKRCRVGLALLLLLTGMPGLHAEGWRELDAQCQQAREEKIKPLREEKIEQCTTVDGQPRDWCERYFRNYGFDGTPRLVLDLPICVQANEAMKNKDG